MKVYVGANGKSTVRRREPELVIPEFREDEDLVDIIEENCKVYDLSRFFEDV